MSTRRPTAPRHQPSTDGSSTLRESFSGTLLVSLAALAAVAPLATDTYLPAFTQMAQDLRVSASSVQLTMTAFLVGVAVGQLVIGVLSDRFGRRPLLVWGTALAFVAGVGTAIAPGIGVLLVALSALSLFIGASSDVSLTGGDRPAEMAAPTRAATSATTAATSSSRATSRTRGARSTGRPRSSARPSTSSSTCPRSPMRCASTSRVARRPARGGPMSSASASTSSTTSGHAP